MKRAISMLSPVLLILTTIGQAMARKSREVLQLKPLAGGNEVGQRVEPAANTSAKTTPALPGEREIWLLSLVCFLSCAAYALYAVSVGWNNTLSDAHAFRQCQTAITASWMVHRSPSLDYETPVLGPPWPIPFEFPVYQWTVAGLATLLGTPLIPTGRFVSLAYFFLSLVPLYLSLGVFRLRPGLRLFVLSLVLVNPFYLFWSRTFLIESTALFFALSFLAGVVVFCGRPSVKVVVASALLGMLAGLTKVTTFVPFLAAALLVLLFDSWRKSDHARWQRNALVAAVLTVSSVAVTALWTHHADTLKMQNPLARNFTSTALVTWNFGTLPDRLDLDKWYLRVAQPLANIQYHPLLLAALGGFVLFMRRGVVHVLICLGLFLFAPLMFFGVHGHSYYAFANLVFFVTALGAGLASGVERRGWFRPTALVLLGLTIGVCIYRHQTLYLPLQSTNVRFGAHVGSALQRLMEPDEILIVYGADWSSEIPFYAERRALMLPQFASAIAVEDALRSAESCRIGAMVVLDPPVGLGVDPSLRSQLSEQRRRMGLSEVPSVAEQGVTIYPAQRYEPAYRRRIKAEGDLARGDWRGAYAALDRCCREVSQEPSFLVGRATCRLHLGDKEEALEDCDRAVNLDPADPALHAARAVLVLSLANQRSQTGQPAQRLLQEAMMSAEQVIRLAPEAPQSYLLRAKVYSALGRKSEADADRKRFEQRSKPPKRFLDNCARLVELPDRVPRTK
jgi:hypothetical protein